MRLKRFLAFIAVVQAILFLTHFVLFETWTFGVPLSEESHAYLIAVLAFLSLTFVSASVLAFRYTNVLVRVFYKFAAVWAGILSFLVIAAGMGWLIFGIARLAGLRLNFHRMIAILFGMGTALGLFGVLNASWTRITRITVRLKNLPVAWRGRKAALISDLHLGPVRNGSFLRRIIAIIKRESPDAVFIAGDMYDGTAIDAVRAAEPLRALSAPQGVYFVAGNHEQFADDTKYLNAVAASGVRVLRNEKVDLDGLQLVGVPWRDAHQNGLPSILKRVQLDPDRASILLTHAPDHPEIAEAAGISLQLSGHTHLGQFVPWSWIARRIYRQFVYGLSRIGNMQVFTSSGAGTWGPPLRLGSNPEIVVLQFE